MPKKPKQELVADFSTLPRCAYIRQPDLLRLYPVSQATLWAYIKGGKFPRPTRLGKRAVGWRYGDVLDWLDGRAGA